MAKGKYLSDRIREKNKANDEAINMGDRGIDRSTRNIRIKNIGSGMRKRNSAKDQM